MNRRGFFNRISSLLAALPAVATALPAVTSTYPRLPATTILSLVSTKVAGFQYYQGEQIWYKLQSSQALELKRQPDNTHDRRAVEVYWQGHKLGYVPRRDNAVIAQMLDNGTTLQASITKLDEDEDDWNRIRFTILAKL